MRTYAAIDLHSNNGVLTVIDENDRVLKQKKLANKLELFVAELEPFRTTLQGVAVESTFNWYWLVDGLLKHKFPMMLVNTAATQQYEGLKHSDDDYDSWWMAHMMRLGILPTGHISPGATSGPRSAAKASEPGPAADGQHPERSEPGAKEPGNENLIE